MLSAKYQRRQSVSLKKADDYINKPFNLKNY